MKTGYDARLGRTLTIEQYKDKYGPKLDAAGTPRTRPRIVCLACNGSLHARGEDSLTVEAVWAHDPNADVICPVKDTGESRYAVLPPTDPDAAAAQALRHAFFANWEKHWGHIREIANYADIDTLVGFLRHADKSNFWAHRGLLAWHIPYIFLATCDFPPPSGVAGKLRRNWLRFRFDARVRTLEDLWIRVLPNLLFLRFHYRKPRTGEPAPAHFIDMEAITPDSTFLTRTFSSPHSYAIRAMGAAFPL